MEQRKTIYFCVEIYYINGVSTAQRNDVPLYCCYFGPGAKSQIQEEGCFVITDDRERLWLCREILNFGSEKQEDYFGQFFRMGYLAHKIGINETGSMFYGNAEDQDDLRVKLNQK